MHLEVGNHFHQNFGSCRIDVWLLDFDTVAFFLKAAAFFFNLLDIALRRKIIVARTVGVVRRVKIAIFDIGWLGN